jgi:hypothetical protein
MGPKREEVARNSQSAGCTPHPVGLFDVTSWITYVNGTSAFSSASPACSMEVTVNSLFLPLVNELINSYRCKGGPQRCEITSRLLVLVEAYFTCLCVKFVHNSCVTVPLNCNLIR